MSRKTFLTIINDIETEIAHWQEERLARHDIISTLAIDMHIESLSNMKRLAFAIFTHMPRDEEEDEI